MKLPSHLSPSKINQFRNCPKQYLYEKQEVRTIPTDDTALVFGLAVHNAILSYFLEISDDPSPGEIEEVADKNFNESPIEIIESNKSRTRKIAEYFVKFEKKRLLNGNYKPTLIEKRFNIELFSDLPPFVGKTDLYVEGQGLLIDWKTGKGIMSDSWMLQGKIYKMALENEGYQVERVVFVGLDTGQSLELPRTTSGWVHQVVGGVVDMIKRDRFPRCVSPLCNWCPFQLACECRGIGLWEI